MWLGATRGESAEGVAGRGRYKGKRRGWEGDYPPYLVAFSFVTDTNALGNGHAWSKLLFKYGITNIRRLENVEPIEIKPITLLLGRNSGGKSTFLRTFPLLRQSIMTRTSSPILWYGDLVDFGSFDTAITRERKIDIITFSYFFDRVVLGERPIFINDQFGYVRHANISPSFKGVKYTTGIQKRGDRTRISSIHIKAVDPKIEIQIELEENNTAKSAVVNGEDIIKTISPAKVKISTGTIYPEIQFIRERVEENGEFWMPNPATSLIPQLTKILRPHVDRRTKDNTISLIAARLISSGNASESFLKEVGKSGQSIGRAIDHILGEPGRETYKQIQTIVNAAILPHLFRAIAGQLKAIFSSTLYIGPMRARSERYYRYQDLAVSEIDPDGKNFPMFLNSLGRNQIEEFSEWVRSLFGYGVSVSRQTGHISINLTEGKVETNIVDVGYGVSQILPVLGQIWWAKRRISNRDNKTPLGILAIEQPELHLHPAHQALLADALVGEASSSSSGMHYLVETHSETLVNRIGEFIAAGRISAKDVQVMLFEPANEGSTTNVRTVNFDEAGALIDWPYGFFQPVDFS